MNHKKIIIGGLIAGVVMGVVDFVGHGVMLMETYSQLGGAGLMQKTPRIPFMPISSILNLVMGISFAWLYAAVRPRLGAGPQTALLLGVILGILMFVPENISTAAWSTYPLNLPFIWIGIGMVKTIAGTFTAALIYKE